MVALSDDLAVIPPGPELAVALEAIELAEVPNDRMLEVLRAQYRLQCHVQARTAAVLAEVGRCAGFAQPGEVQRLPEPERFAAEESRAALRWTRRAAQDEHDLAETIVNQRPAVFAAWLAGDIDRPRVRVFDHYLTGLNDAQVAGICRVAVPRAHGMTTGQLAVLLRRMVIAVDPDAAARWYREGIRRRGVIAYPAPDGTITLSAHGLPADEAEAACTRLQELAARAKRAGHPGIIDQIRADLYLGLLDGRFHGLTIDQVITALINDHTTDEPERAVGATPAGSEPSVPPPAAPERPAASSTSEQPAGESVAPERPTDESAAPEHPAPSSEPDADRATDQRVGIEIRVGLATLLGLDEYPADIPGLGLLPAPDARRRAHLQSRAEWRFALTDAQGRLIFDGITRRRPERCRRDGPPGGIVELHVPLHLLNELVADSGPTHREWADLITDIASQYSKRDDQRRDLDTHPDARLPGAALRRHTEIRDRTCSFVGCRRRAHASDQDHTRDYGHGGATVQMNLGPMCPHDHRVKHLGGWRVDQPAAGVFAWQSPLGGCYRAMGESFLPPMPDLAPSDPAPTDLRPGSGPCREQSPLIEPTGPILRRPAPARPPLRRPLPLGTPDDPPPF